MKPVVYIDMLFLLNFLINSVTICTSSFLVRKKPSVLRLVFSAGFSALYSTFMFFPQISFLYSLLFKAFFLAFTAWIAFPAKRPLLILKNALIFFGVNLVFGGAAFFMIFCTDFGTKMNAAVSNGEIYLDISFEMLLFSTVLSYITVYIISYIKVQTAKTEKITATVTVIFNNRQITERALWDTGCTLCDPIFGYPAVIISPDCAKKLLSDNFFEGIFEKSENKYRILPFRTVDCDCGVLHGFLPDALIVDGTEISHSVVAVSKTSVARDSEFSAILNPKLLENKSQGKAVNNCEKTEILA